jgi:DNA-binding beta-propeller fold protein YncE
MRCFERRSAKWLLWLVFSLPVAGFAGTAPEITILPPLVHGATAPLRVATDSAGNMYVTDASSGLLKYNMYGRLMSSLALPVPAKGLAVIDGTMVLVSQGNFVLMLDPELQVVRRLGNGAGQFKSASGITFDENRHIYVVDSGSQCVQVFNAVGDYLARFGSFGLLAGQFNNPTGIAYERISRQIVVADTFNSRLQFFDTANYSWKKTLGSLGSAPLKFGSPQGISFEYVTDALTGLEKVSRMYVVDGFQSCVQVIDPTSTPTFLTFIGSYGYNNGQLVVPADVSYDPVTKRLLIANGFGNITFFGIDGGSTPADPEE